MSKDQSIKETLDVIRRALEDDDTKEFQNDVLILNKQVIDDGTIKNLSKNKSDQENIKQILDSKINEIFDQKLDKVLEKKIPDYINKYLKK